MGSSKNIDSFNKVVAFALGRAYEGFPCEVRFNTSEMYSMCEYGCDGLDNSSSAKDEFIRHCIGWLDEEVGLIRCSEGFGVRVEIMLTIKGLQHLKKTPDSLKTNIGSTLSNNIKEYSKDKVNKAVDGAISFCIDALLEGLA